MPLDFSMILNEIKSDKVREIYHLSEPGKLDSEVELDMKAYLKEKAIEYLKDKRKQHHLTTAFDGVNLDAEII